MTGTVPEWVHMAEVPPTDEEPRGRCEHGALVGGCLRCYYAGDDEPGHVTPVGGWILVALLILGVLVAVIWRVLR